MHKVNISPETTIQQLESLQVSINSFIPDQAPESIWCKGVKAINEAIKIIRTYDTEITRKEKERAAGMNLDGFISRVPFIDRDKERGKIVTARCGCGGTIRAMRKKANGHICVKCDGCGMGVID